LSHISSPFCSGYFRYGDLSNYLPILASNCYPPGLSLSGSQDDRYEPLAADSNFILSHVIFLVVQVPFVKDYSFFSLLKNHLALLFLHCHFYSIGLSTVFIPASDILKHYIFASCFEMGQSSNLIIFQDYCDLDAFFALPCKF
jgi:hypothetical protein